MSVNASEMTVISRLTMNPAVAVMASVHHEWLLIFTAVQTPPDCRRNAQSLFGLPPTSSGGDRVAELGPPLGFGRDFCP